MGFDAENWKPTESSRPGSSATLANRTHTWIKAENPGPLIFVVGAMHGNELAGLVAGERVVAALADSGSLTAGEVLVVVGNRQAMKRGRRYIDRDLNRRWDAKGVQRLLSRRKDERSREDKEQQELLSIFEELTADPERQAIYLDLHSTSGEAAPFACVMPTPENQALCAHLDVPQVLDLQRYIDSPSMVWWVERGRPALGIEGGLHEDPETVDRLERVIWETLRGLEMVEEIPSDRLGVGGVDAALRGRSFRVVHRRGVIPGMSFLMEPGFHSFQGIREGQVLATERTGTVRSPCDGYIFLPRYQDQGDDGFFIMIAADEDPSLTR